MKLLAISFKECWRAPNGAWLTDGGFPLQMAALASLFDGMTLLITECAPRAGGIPLPPVEIVPVKRPEGSGIGRKWFVLAHLGHYWGTYVRHARAADAVHVPLPGDLPLVGMAAAVRARRPLIARYGGAWTANSRTTWMNRITRQSMRALAGGRNVMFAAGEGDEPPARGIQWLFSTALAEAELAAIRPVTRPGPQDPPRAVCIGRLSPEKSIDKLLAAVARLRQESFQPMPKFTFIGDGPERARLEALAVSLGCAGDCAFLGQLDRAALSARLLEQDFSVHPSSTESLCKAWLDAMAHGLPVLAAEVGSARQAIGAAPGHRGWLVRPDSPEALADGLRRALVETPDWTSLRRRCREYAEARTLEAWARIIGAECSRRWGVPMKEGRPAA